MPACSAAGPEPRLTRDVVKARFEYFGQQVEVLDTAGWMKHQQMKMLSDEEERVMLRLCCILLLIQLHMLLLLFGVSCL